MLRNTQGVSFMLNINISDEVKNLCPNTVLGCIQGKIKVQKSTKELLQKIDQHCENEKHGGYRYFKTKNIRYKEGVSKLGKDPLGIVQRRKKK